MYDWEKFGGGGGGGGEKKEEKGKKGERKRKRMRWTEKKRRKQTLVVQKSETRMTASVLKQDLNPYEGYKKEGGGGGSLFIRTQTYNNLQIFEVIPLVKLQSDT